MLRLKIFQESAHFRIPTIGIPYLSYPLVPPSTIYGFLREITGKVSINYLNTRLSIQGMFEGVSFGKERLILTTKSETKTNIINIQKLHELSTVIHIDTTLEFEEKLLNSVNNYSGAFRLGRLEDLIIDLSLEKVERKEIYSSFPSDSKKMLFYEKWVENTDSKGSLFNMCFDTVVDDDLKIIGRNYINLLYKSSLKIDSKYNDDNYIISFI